MEEENLVLGRDEEDTVGVLVGVKACEGIV